MKLFSFVCLFVTLAAPPSFATSFYVSTSGSNSNSGTSEKPFRSIAYGVSKARPGDTVFVRGGTYYEVVRITSDGSSDAWITIQSKPGETATISGSNSGSDTTLVQFSNANYVRFLNFKVVNSKRTGISFYGGSNIQIKGNTITGSRKSAIMAMERANNILIDNNTINNNVLVNRYRNASWNVTVLAGDTNKVTITNNRVFRNYGEGIGFLRSDNGLAARNTIYDNYSVNLYLDNAQYCTLEGNFIYNGTDSSAQNHYRDGHPANGISIANESYSVSNPSNYNKILNNIVINSKRGFTYSNYERGGGLENTFVANNTFFKATQRLLNIDYDSHSNSEIANNIFYQTNGKPMSGVAGSGVRYHHNLWYGGSAGTAAGSGDVVNKNPLLVKAGGLLPADYKLQSASLAKTKGSYLPAVGKDYFGATRSVYYDIGAHEYSQ